MSLESRCSSLRKHLSKSASELSCKECTGSITSDTVTPFPSPQRAKSAANPNVSTVLQRTSGFLSGLKVKFHKFLKFYNNFLTKISQNRWSRGRSKERGRKSPGSCQVHDDDRDSDREYAADNSSDHSSSATPFESPRHRASTLADSPLARPRNNNETNNYNNKNSTTAKVECEPSTSGYVPNNLQQSTYDVMSVSEIC